MPAIEQAKVCPACRSRRGRVVLLVAVSLTSSIAGYVIGDHRSKEAVFQEGRRQLEEFLRIGTELGIVAVDHQKLEEAGITSSEAEWEDRDAAERQHDTTKTDKVRSVP